MAKAPALKPNEIAVGALCLALGANYLGVLYWEYPFIACAVKPLAVLLYAVFGQLAMIILMLACVYQLLRKNAIGLIGAAIALTFIIELPRFAAFLFLMGASCGGT